MFYFSYKKEGISLSITMKEYQIKYPDAEQTSHLSSTFEIEIHLTTLSLSNSKIETFPKK